MINFHAHVDKAQGAYINALRAYAMINEDGAVKLHKRFEKRFAKALNTVFMEMVSDIASSIKPNTRNKPNPEAQEILGGHELIPTNSFPYEQPQVDGGGRIDGEFVAPRGEYTPTPEEIEAIKEESALEEPTGVMKSNPMVYIDTNQPAPATPPTRTQESSPNPSLGQPISGQPVRTINPDGTRVG